MLDAKLFTIHIEDDHFADIIQFLTIGMAPEGYTTEQRKELVLPIEEFSFIAGHLYKMGVDEILQSMWRNLSVIVLSLNLMRELRETIM